MRTFTCRSNFLYGKKRLCLYHSVFPVCVVMNDFYPKTGARTGAEKALSSSSLNLPHLPYSFRVFSADPLFCSSTSRQTLCVETEESSPLLPLHMYVELVLSLVSRGSDSGKCSSNACPYRTTLFCIGIFPQRSHKYKSVKKEGKVSSPTYSGYFLNFMWMVYCIISPPISYPSGSD